MFEVVRQLMPKKSICSTVDIKMIYISKPASTDEKINKY